MSNLSFTMEYTGAIIANEIEANADRFADAAFHALLIAVKHGVDVIIFFGTTSVLVSGYRHTVYQHNDAETTRRLAREWFLAH